MERIDHFTLANPLRADNLSITDKKRGPKVSAIERFYCIVDPLEDTAKESLIDILRHQFVTLRKKKVYFMDFDSESFN